MNYLVSHGRHSGLARAGLVSGPGEMGLRGKQKFRASNLVLTGSSDLVNHKASHFRRRGLVTDLLPRASPRFPCCGQSSAVVSAAEKQLAAQRQQRLSKQHTTGPNAVPDYANPEQMNRNDWYVTAQATPKAGD